MTKLPARSDAAYDAFHADVASGVVVNLAQQ
jgi:hypothetical protein